MRTFYVFLIGSFLILLNGCSNDHEGAADNQAQQALGPSTCNIGTTDTEPTVTYSEVNCSLTFTWHSVGAPGTSEVYYDVQTASCGSLSYHAISSTYTYDNSVTIDTRGFRSIKYICVSTAECGLSYAIPVDPVTLASYCKVKGGLNPDCDPVYPCECQ
jgi:hypothetical protein